MILLVSGAFVIEVASEERAAARNAAYRTGFGNHSDGIHFAFFREHAAAERRKTDTEVTHHASFDFHNSSSDDNLLRIERHYFDSVYRHLQLTVETHPEIIVSVAVICKRTADLTRIVTYYDIVDEISAYLNELRI